MWDALKGICNRERLSIHEVCTRIDEPRQDGTSLTSAVRTFLGKYVQLATTEEGHERAGHGNGQPFGWAPVRVDRERVRGGREPEEDEVTTEELELETEGV